jgi:hypothetical protein
MTEYVLDNHRFSRLHTAYGGVFCRKCGKALRVGDLVVSNNNGGCSVKLYHKVCWDSLFLDL